MYLVKTKLMFTDVHFSIINDSTTTPTYLYSRNITCSFSVIFQQIYIFLRSEILINRLKGQRVKHTFVPPRARISSKVGSSSSISITHVRKVCDHVVKNYSQTKPLPLFLQLKTRLKMTSSFVLRVLSASLCAANKSGSIIREVFKSGKLGIVQKVRGHVHVYSIMTECVCLQGVNDPQTEADRRAQRCIFATLKKRFPKINIIGEEVNALMTTPLSLFDGDAIYKIRKRSNLACAKYVDYIN